MSFLRQLQADREIDVKFWRKHPELRMQLVEEAYQHKAHFIYELLQNAEDARATFAVFDLHADRLEFRHNGEKLFTETDVDAITDVSKSGKSDNGDTIGKFGIGFKSVFQYTEAPSVYSGDWSFRIVDFVYPETIRPIDGLESDTLFVFPFNGQRKSPQEAYKEIEAGLQGLAETTLLFLSNLKSVGWRVNGGESGEIRTVQHPDNHVEVQKKIGKKQIACSHFLRFSVPAEGLPRHSVSIAFVLDFLPSITAFDPGESIAKQLKIAPATPGRVAVFFPAEAENSGLRFHLHAPCVTVLNRASIKDTPANEPLFGQLAKLAASSLHAIRDLGLLSAEFLGVLPNSQDPVPPRYRPIRTAIVAEMKYEPLTPTYAKSHAPARHLLQAKASLKELLSKKDLEFLVPLKAEPQWAVGASQRNSNQDRFLTGLEITEWDSSQFIDLLAEKCADVTTYISHSPWYVSEPDPEFMKWLTAKPAEWHQALYALLYNEPGLADRLHRLKKLRIVRLSDGSYSAGCRSYFPIEGVQHDKVLPRVDHQVYTSGNSRTQQGEARKFLEEIGVRVVGEAEEIESILKQRYTAEALHPDPSDLARFIRLYESDPTKAKLFDDYHIFRLANGDSWAKPSKVFLDLPYLDTGLAAYHEALGTSATRWALSDSYEKDAISSERLRKFCEAVGVQVRLDVKRRSTGLHPSVHTLQKDWYGYRVRRTDSMIDDDWYIENLPQVLASQSIPLSRLIWRTLCDSPSRVLQARFRPNQQYDTRVEPSSLVLLLRETPWIPQKGGGFVCPIEASKWLLPEGFPFVEGREWLEAVRFGLNEWVRSHECRQRQDTLREFGFADEETLQSAQWFAALTSEERQRLKADVDRRRFTVLPEQEAKDPERRAQRVALQAVDAAPRVAELRTRSVQVGLEEVKQEAEQYLRQQYTNPDGEMICQVCKAPLPFKLDDGSYYVEKVEFLPELQRRHYQNYIALCPLHSAMYQHANGSRNLIKEMFMALERNELEVVLAREDHTIYFTKTHIADLKAVIEADGDAAPSDDG